MRELEKIQMSILNRFGCYQYQPILEHHLAHLISLDAAFHSHAPVIFLFDFLHNCLLEPCTCIQCIEDAQFDQCNPSTNHSIHSPIVPFLVSQPLD